MVVVYHRRSRRRKRGCRAKAIGYSFGCGGKNWEERPAGGCSCAVKDTASRRMLCVCLCVCVCERERESFYLTFCSVLCVGRGMLVM